MRSLPEVVKGFYAQASKRYTNISMRVIEPYQLRKLGHKKRLSGGFAILIIIVLVTSYIAVAMIRPIPKVSAKTLPLNATASTPTPIKWPASGQAAFGAVGFGVLAESGAQTPAPIASVAKIITALAVLKQKPLQIGEQGPMLTIDQSDVQAYRDYVAKGGSVVPINFGEQISEYQALQAMLLPSANNMAFTLSKWAFGSVDAYISYAEGLTTSLGLKQTHIADESGFSPQTTSTPHDLVLLGQAAASQPIITEIVNQKTATIPVAGEIHNVNLLLGQKDINGIKTGNTSEAGGCLLFSATHNYPNNQKATIIGAVVGSKDLPMAMRDTLALLSSVTPNFQITTVVKKSQVIALYKAPWQAQASAIASQDVSLLTWAGNKPVVSIELQQLSAPAYMGTTVGKVTLQSGSTTKIVPLNLSQDLPPPTRGWRLSHPLVSQ